MNTELIDVLSDEVENACKDKSNVYGYGIWTHHVKPMIPLAQKLAREFNADEEIVTISTILHDLAGIQKKENRENHHLLGAELAEQLLREKKYPEERIRHVQECIKNHRSSVNNPKSTIEEVCVADADAIVHMTELSSLFYAAYKKMNMEIDEGKNWIRGKIDRDWMKMSERSKELYKATYEMIREILG